MCGSVEAYGMHLLALLTWGKAAGGAPSSPLPSTSPNPQGNESLGLEGAEEGNGGEDREDAEGWKTQHCLPLRSQTRWVLCCGCGG